MWKYVLRSNKKYNIIQIRGVKMEEINNVLVNFDDRVFNVKIESDKKIDVNLDNILKLLDSSELYDYFYSYHKIYL